MLAKTGLVLEGGGMRGIFTSGVLDLFLDKRLDFDYVIGVSAGVCNGVSYISGQRGRSRNINLNYITDKRYLSFSNLLKTGSLFGMDFLFDEIPNRLDVFDMEAFRASKKQFLVGVTDVQTGKAVYFGDDMREHINIISRASSAIPVFSPIVEFGGGRYLDGGASDPIPVKKAVEDGCDKVVVVLTRNRSFVKKPEPFRVIYSMLYRRYPNMVKALDNRHIVYNKTLEYIRALEKQGAAFVLAPEMPLAIGRFEKNRQKLQALYEHGYRQAAEKYDEIMRFLEGGPLGGVSLKAK